jgi:uncharacterized protein YdaU (DUF1376 family)
MPLFNGDLLADTMHLSAQEFGAYMLLIIHAWKHDGRVPYDRVARIARVRADQWPKVFKRLEPYFQWDTDPMGHRTYGTQYRVLDELHNAGEITNKRKDAALQMHSKRRASASVLHMHPPSQSLRDASLGKGSEAPTVQVQVNYRDPGVDYRSPPRTRSDNVLEPLPLLAAKGKDEA